MVFPNPVTLIVNGFTLSLATGFVLIILWYDARKAINQFFAIFLFLVIVWNTGFLLSQAAVLIDAGSAVFDLVYGITQAGFTGSTVALYVIVTILAGIHTRRFRILAFVSLIIVIGYNSFLIVSTQFNTSSQQENSISFLFFMSINTLTTYLTWHYRQKILNSRITTGILLFVTGQGLAFLNQDLGITATAFTICAVGCLILSFSIIQDQIITPLKNQELQLRAMHEVAIAITGQIPTDTILKEIARQAKNRIDADAACIFLKKDNQIELVALYNLPERLEGLQLNKGEGVAGSVIQKKTPLLIENYSRDWKGTPDIPNAHLHFGGIICVPLTYKENVIGTLMTINGKNSKVPKKEDVKLLELLSSQAAVAISQGLLFKEQQSLADQLRKVLISTENPVIATDRQLRLIFINPAAEKLLQLKTEDQHKRITEIIPTASLPPGYRTILRDIHKNRTYTYEISTAGETYLCHLTSLGEHKIEGWVAVLNNITRLKELDRIKSEVVRMTSHDLKNPLQAAMAHIDLLKDDLQELDANEDLLLSASKVEKQLEKMNRIIGGILDLERIRTSTSLQETCNTASILRSAISELYDIAQDRHIVLNTNIEENIAEFQGDTGQFERAIVNLIENAIKFTPQEGQVSLTAYNHQDKIIIIVSDTGIGIPENIQEHIFERFYRGQQPGAEHISGSGLGLNLVKTVIDNHRGYIEVTSKPGTGTKFTITIPAISTRSPAL